ncbi:synaptotagmin-9-like [Polyodon spathula]|uniref:synaptotagmin-9-like n=1 Tax=Polyodon spathula TaxID=7913 RepID=UPI001B7F1082|nr:synaptotagmin-9-like [Polyodon spathula]
MSESGLEVHLQTLLGVGLAVLCFCLILGCILCWRRRRSQPCQDKSLSSDHVALDLGPAFSPKISPTSPISIKQQYQELEGDVLEYPVQPPCSCSYPSPEHKFRPRSTSELDANYKTSYQLQRQSNLSSYEKSPPFKPGCHGRASLPTIPKLNLVSKTKQALERRFTVTGATFIYKHSKLNSPGASEHSKPNSLGASEHNKLNSLGASEHSKLNSLGASKHSKINSLGASEHSKKTRLLNSRVRQSHTLPGEISEISDKVPPRIQFRLFFSPKDGSLTVSVLSLANVPRKIGVSGGCYVQLSLLPCCLETLQTSVRPRSLNPEFREDFRFEVGAVEYLRVCTLCMAVFSKDFPSLRASCLGKMLLPCGQVEWGTGRATSYSRELSSTKTKLKKSQSTQDVESHSSSISIPKALGQLFILLQYQTLAHRIKVMVRKAENLGKLNRIPGTPDHYVVITLRHGGSVIVSKETKAASGYNAVWNAPFLFDMPPGEIHELPLSLEFIIMQGHIYTRTRVLGHVLIGCDALEEGQAHWKDMCSRGQVETARWHTIQPDSL